MIQRSIQLIVAISMFLVFSLSTAISMEAPEESVNETAAAAPEEYQKTAPVIEPPIESNETRCEAEPEEYQNKAPIIPGFSIWQTMSMLLAGLIILPKKYFTR